MDKFVTGMWVMLACTVIGIGLAAAECSAAGGLTILAGAIYFFMCIPLDLAPPRKPEPEAVEVHHHVTTTNVYQLPRYDRVTEGIQLDLRNGKVTKLVRWD